MALRLRRGTDAERLLMDPVPAAGELIYTTDTKAVWVGDGTTVGGIPVSGEALGINDLGDVVISDELFPGDVIQYDGTQWISAPAPDKTGNIYGRDSTLLIDSDNSVIVGPIVTDTAIVGDLIGDVTGNANGDHTGTFTGAVTGTLDGDVTGSVFADDSSILIDAVNRRGTLSANISLDRFDLQATDVALISTDTGFVNVGGNVGDTYVNSTVVVKRQADTASAYISENYGDSNSRNTDLKTVKYRGTIDSPAAVQTNDNLFELTSNGYDGADVKGAGGINWIATGTAGSLAIPSKVQINVGNVAGDAASTFIGDSDGSWITDIMKLNPLSSAPATPAAGMIAVDDGSNWSGVATNGTDETVVAYLNSSWVKLG
jgi:hypothetical protein